MRFEIKVCVFRPDGREFYQAQWKDPVTGKKKTKSTGKKTRRDAERVAATLQKELTDGKYRHPSLITWEEFRQRYESEVLPGLAKRTHQRVDSVFDSIERLISPARLTSVDSAQISLWTKLMRESGLSENTIKSNLAHLKAAIRWAHRQKMVHEIPQFQMPSRTNKATCRAPTGEEFDRMLAAVPDVADGAQVEEVRYLLRGLWWGGLRIGEALELFWDDHSKIRAILDGRRPLIQIPPDHQKNGEETLLPMAPELYAVLMETPPEERTGRVFKVHSVARGHIRYKTPRLMKYEAVGEMICKIGKRAGVKVSPSAYASAHDLRRAFGVRWSKRVMPAILKTLMRHKDITTTMKYYVVEAAEDTADVVWQTVANTFANSGAISSVPEDLRIAVSESGTILLSKFPTHDSNVD